MKTQKEQQWAGTLKYSWHDDRRILLSTIALSKSDAITALLNDWPEVHEGCKNRRSKWKKMKADERQFQVVPITISVDGEDGEDGEDVEVKPKRCCNNCFFHYRYTKDDIKKHRCNNFNFPNDASIIDKKRFVCKDHKYYNEVFPNG